MISRLSPVALTLLTALAAPGVLAQSDTEAADAEAPADDAEAADELAPAGEVDDSLDGAEPEVSTDEAPTPADDAAAAEASADDDAAADEAPASDDEPVDEPRENAAEASAPEAAAPGEPTTDEGGFNVTVGAVTGDAAAEDQAVHDAAVEVETDNLRRALYAGIGMGALGALAGVVSIAATAGAVAMLTVPTLDPTIRTQGGPLLWFGISGILVGAVTTAAGGGLIGWSLLSDPEEAVDAVGNADPDAATTQQNNPPMAR